MDQRSPIMPCCRGQDYDRMFDAHHAARELKVYERRGPRGATRRLLRAILNRLKTGSELTHLDIGGGVGVLQHEMAKRGALRITAVDASVPYLILLERAAGERGYVDRQTRIAGDFIEVDEQVEPATIVTLDKVLCCYPHVEELVRRSAKKAKSVYAIVVPRDGPLARAFAAAGNWFLRYILRRQFRAFVHRHDTIDTLCSRLGLELQEADQGLVWCVRLYERPDPPTS